jgi:hypothetical protein
LHWQSQASLFSAILNRTGVNLVPVCVPSQNGCLELFPQAHQANGPGSRVTWAGIFAAINGFSMIIGLKINAPKFALFLIWQLSGLRFLILWFKEICFYTIR